MARQWDDQSGISWGDRAMTRKWLHIWLALVALSAMAVATFLLTESAHTARMKSVSAPNSPQIGHYSESQSPSIVDRNQSEPAPAPFDPGSYISAQHEAQSQSMIVQINEVIMERFFGLDFV